MASDRKPYHRSCVKCYTPSCRIPLNPRTLNEHEEQLYCNVCYEKIFNPADFTVDNYGGIVTPEDIERYYVRKIMKNRFLQFHANFTIAIGVHPSRSQIKKFRLRPI